MPTEPLAEGQERARHRGPRARDPRRCSRLHASHRAPFVGRRAELELLERALETAVETRAPQLATIVGPPGIGKSRLARELIGRAGTRVLVGRCLSYGEGMRTGRSRRWCRRSGTCGWRWKKVPTEISRRRGSRARSGTRTRPPRPRSRVGRAEALRGDGPGGSVIGRLRRHPLGRVHVPRPDRVRDDVRTRHPAAGPVHSRADLFDQRPTWTAPRPTPP